MRLSRDFRSLRTHKHSHSGKTRYRRSQSRLWTWILITFCSIPFTFVVYCIAIHNIDQIMRWLQITSIDGFPVAVDVNTALYHIFPGADLSPVSLVDSVQVSSVDDDLLFNESVLYKYINFRHKINDETVAGMNERQLALVRRPLRAFELFDWVIWDPKHGPIKMPRGKPPRHVLVYSGGLVEFTRYFYSGGPSLLPALQQNETRSIVFAGEDTHLTKDWLHSRIYPLFQQKKFSHFWFEAKDKDIRSIFPFPPKFNVRTIPVGLVSSYVIRAGLQNVQRAIDMSDNMSKGKLLCAAWGAMHPRLDSILSHRSSLLSFLKNNSNWVTRSSWPITESWMQISNCHFLICPPGQGIQTARVTESWLVRTVPITIDLPAFRDLRDMGFPLILVKSWSDITLDNVKKWANESSSIDWIHVREMLTFDHIMRRIMGEFD